MTSTACTVAVDVGNSAVKLCVRKSRREREGVRTESLDEHSIGLGQLGWQDAAIAWAGDHARSQDNPCGRIAWWIASVHREAADQLSHAIENADGEARIRRIQSFDVPIIADVEQPDRVGVDRMLGAFAARNRTHGAVVVVDAGSAITVDWVCEQGQFRGGAIMPGLGLQTRALATGTDALPKINWQSVENRPGEHAVVAGPLRPARHTGDAIRLGVLTGVAAGIDRLAHDYAMAAGDPRKPAFILTGGDAGIISPRLKHEHRCVSNLVCRGLLDMADSEADPVDRA